MAISLNPKELDVLRQVAFLVDFIRDPDKVKAIADQARDNAERLEAAIAAHTTVDQANKYLDKAEAEVVLIQASVDALKLEKQELQTDMQRILTEHKAETEASMRLIVEASQALERTQRAFDETKTAFKEEQQALEVVKAQILEREQKLDLAEKSQKDRAAQIAALAKAA